MNWYKNSIDIIGQIAVEIVGLLMQAAQGVQVAVLDKISSIVAALPDEQSLEEAINKAVAYATHNGQYELSEGQESLLTELRAAFYQHAQRQPKIEPEAIPETGLTEQFGEQPVEEANEVQEL